MACRFHRGMTLHSWRQQDTASYLKQTASAPFEQMLHAARSNQPRDAKMATVELLLENWRATKAPDPFGVVPDVGGCADLDRAATARQNSSHR